MRIDRRELIGAAAWFTMTAGLRAAWPPPGQAPSAYAANFPALAQRVNGRNLAYLDSAATTLRPAAVVDAIADFYRTSNANPSGTMHTLARRSARQYAEARETVARFLSAAPEELVWVRGTTEAINLVASSFGSRLQPGDEVLISVAEHYSNLLPWRAATARAGARLRVFDVDDEGRFRMDDLERQLSPRTKLVAITHVSNVVGVVNPVKEVVKLAKHVGAAVLVDGAQSIPHLTIDVPSIGCDFFAWSSHKVLGPMGTGVLWARRDRLEEMPPYQTGSNMAHNVDVESAEWEHGGLKFQAGTPDVSGPIGLAAAVRFITSLGPGAIAAHDRILVDHALNRMRDVRGLKLLGPATARDRMPVFSFTMANRKVPEIVAAMDQEGIAIRGGDLAALPLLRRLGTDAAARASCYIYNTTDDIDRFADVLVTLARP